MAPLLSVLSGVGVWVLAAWAGLIDGTLIPTPGAVARACVDSCADGTLFYDVSASMLRLVPGLTIGVTLGVLLGLGTGLFLQFGRIVSPYFNIMRALPAVALIPFFVILLGIGDTAKVVMIAFGAFFPAWISTHQGALGVPSDLFEFARNYQLSRYSRCVYVVLPAVLPFVIAGARTSLATAFVLLFVSEWVGANLGVGYRISVAHVVGRMDTLVLNLGVLGLLASLSDWMLRATCRRLWPWSSAGRDAGE
jgi:ABC-type nitrate/sulfonate/bicarbonate transport system permease component